MKKILSFTLMSLALTFLNSANADVVGVVDTGKIQDNYTKVQRAADEISDKYAEIQRYALDKERKFNETNTEALIDLIYEIMFTDRLCEKITRMVEENYLDDIEKGDESGKYKKNNKEYLESLEFTNEHIKILLRISFGIKIMSPVLFHYLTLNNMNKLDKDSDLIYKFYERLFPLFSGNCDMFNKLFVYVKFSVKNSVMSLRKTSLIAGNS